MPETDSPKEPVKGSKRILTRFFVLQILISLILLITVIRNLGPLRRLWVREQSFQESRFVPAREGTWRFMVSGDSRNCGDVVMPAIAAQGIEKYHPAFYWHLGDLRAIYKVDEDIAAAAQKAGQHLSCEDYQKGAWQDFIDHQILPFGNTRFYLGIGNHELIPPKNVNEFSSTFQDWLLTPRLMMQGQEKQAIAAAKTGACQKIASRPYLSSTPYYHWTRGGIDFIYLDNSSGAFATDQLDWFDCILERAGNNQDIKAVVVGMHEALPSSRASGHAMCDDAIKDLTLKKQSCDSGNHVYDALVAFKKTKPVYVLASHSHFYMKGIFDNHPGANRLNGWIVGTAGAVRYALPQSISAGPDAIVDRYGYLLGTVDGSSIEFQFQPVAQSDIPAEVSRRYPPTFISWCFAKNSQNLDRESEETTNRCPTPASRATSPRPARKP